MPYFRFFIILIFLPLFFVLTYCSRKKVKTYVVTEQNLSNDPTRKDIPAKYRELLPILDSMYKDDTKYRFLQKSTSDELKLQEEAFKKNKDEVIQLDLKNQERLKFILENYGYPSAKQISLSGSISLFSVLQHSPYEFQKKYEKLVDSAKVQGAIAASNYALFKDRIKMKEKLPQLYGTQIVYSKDLKEKVIYPILNPTRIQNTRDSIGIKSGLYSNYLKLWKIEWDSIDYQKKLPIIIKEFNVKYPIE